MSNVTIQVAQTHDSQPTSSKEASVATPRRDPRAAVLRSDKITEEHLQRQAIVYVRQSTQRQVFENRESTARQYALADRAGVLGWPACWSAVVAATEDIERERKQLDDHWKQRLARSRYEVEQARRQYAAVDPEYRLVLKQANGDG